MKRLSQLLLVIILILTVNKFQAQPWNSLLPKDKVENNSLTFFEIQKAFNDYWTPKNVVSGYYQLNGVKTKAGGWKQFKRWEWYWENRVDPQTGAFPNTSAFEEYQKIVKATGEQRSPSGQWTSMGPGTSPGGYAGLGRLNCIGFHPGNNDVLYVGAASGGVWKSIDGGSSWIPKSDDIGAIGISDIIVIPTSGDDIVYIATGDRDASDTYSVGVLKSTDGGTSWANTGLTFSAGDNRLINRLLMDPNDNDVLYAATSIGVYKSTDAGVNWNLITGTNFIDLEFRPNMSNIMYGSTKQGEVYKTTDSGTNWNVTLSTGGYRTEIAVSPQSDYVVYALIAASNNGLFGIYRSTNSGDSFSVVYNGINLLGWDCSGGDSGGQGWYDLCIAADPNDVNTVFLGGVNTWKSTNGGSTWNINNHWSSTCGGSATTVHADKHNLTFQNGSSTLFECNDGGLYSTSNGGSTWSHLTNGMVISQMYRLGVAQTTSADVITGLQDNGTKALITSTWTDVIGGDGMECLIDYSNEYAQYGSLYYGQILRTTNHWVSSTTISGGIGGSGAWVTPYIQDPNNSLTLFVGFQDVWKSTNQGDNWTQLSSWGGNTLRSIAVAPSNSNYIYAATTSTLYGTSDGGSNWSNLTGTLPVGSSSITYISVKYDDPNIIWVSMGQFNNYGVFESTDGGSSWTDISTGLPSLPTNCVIQNRQNTIDVELYAATDVGVYLKYGVSDWTPYFNDMPNVVVSELEIYYDDVTPANSMLRAATYGRGLWESDLYLDQSVLTANFSADVTSIETGEFVQFTDASIGTLTSWEWTFPGGTPAIFVGQTPPPIQYNTEGLFDVTLEISDGTDTDTYTITDYIEVIFYPWGNVNGYVTDAITSVPIEGADVAMVSGANSYMFITDANGYYEGQILEGTYNYEVSAETYVTSLLTDILIEYDVTVTNDFALEEFPYPVANVTATEQDANSVLVNWDWTFINEWLMYGDGTHVGNWSFGDGLSFNTAINFDPVDLTDLDGASLTKFAVYNFDQDNTTANTLMIYEGDFIGGTATLLHEQGIVDLLPADWNEIELTVSVPIDVTQQLWIVVNRPAVHAGTSASDSESNIKGDWLDYNGNWVNLSTEFGIAQVWNMSVFATEALTNRTTQIVHREQTPLKGVTGNAQLENLIAEGDINNTPFPPEINTRGIVNYNVYRGLWDDNFADMTLIGNTIEMEFLDSDWGTQTSGVYNWAVEVVYTNNNSQPTYSNNLDKDMETQVVIEVSLNSSENPEGAVVTLTNISEPLLGLEYNLTIDASGLDTINPIRKGVYNLEITLEGYYTFTETDIGIYNETNFQWILEEILYTPFGLYVNPRGMANWRDGSIPFEPFIENFDGLADGELPTGWTKSPETTNWSASLSANAGGVLPEMRFNWNPSSINTFYLMTPVMSTVGLSELQFSFKHMVNDYNGDYTLRVVAIADGVEYIINEWLTPMAIPAEQLNFLLDVNHGVGAHDFQIAWVLDGDSYNINYWYIDDVMLNLPENKSGRSLQTYRVSLDNVFSGNTTDTYYDYEVAESLVEGVEYTASIEAEYTTGLSDTAFYTFIYHACDYYNPATNFTATRIVGTMNFVLEWTNDTNNINTDLFIGTNIYRDAGLIAFVPVDTETYNEDLYVGNYNYCITQLYESGAESCEACVEAIMLGTYVDGFITEFETGSPIEGVEVALYNGTYFYIFTTDAMGYYEGEVIDGTYDYTVSAISYETNFLNNVLVTYGTTVTKDTTLLDFPYPVGNVLATEQEDHSVLVDWNGIPQWLYYDDGTNIESYGSGGDFTLAWASKYEDYQLLDYQNYAITKIQYYGSTYGATVNSISVMIWSGDDASTLLYSEDVTSQIIFNDDWNEFYLAAAVPFDNTETLWIGFYAEGPGNCFPATVGLQSFETNNADYLNFNANGWQQLADYGDAGLAWNTRAFVTNEFGKILALGQLPNKHKPVKAYPRGKLESVKNHNPNASRLQRYLDPNTRAFVGYNVYRGACNAGPNDMTLVGNTTEKQYIDNTVTPGIFSYAVEVVYDYNASEYTYSNCVDVDMITTVNVAVTTNSGDSPAGGEVVFVNISEPANPPIIFETVLDDIGLYTWTDFRKGIYNISVRLDGFNRIISDSISIWEESDFDYLLIERIISTTGLYVTPTGYASWDEFEPYFQNFNGGLPEDWIINPDTMPTWFWTADAAGNTLDGTPFMFVDSDAAGTVFMEVMLTSPVIESYGGIEELWLEFDQYFHQGYDPAAYADIEVFDGTEWVTILHQAGTNMGSWNTPNHQMIDVTDFSNPYFQVRFFYSATYDYWWAIDNFSVNDGSSRSSGRSLQTYKVWLDGSFITDCDNNFYQYGDNGETLVSGETYLSEVATVYTTGTSDTIAFEWTYMSCDSFPGPDTLTGEQQDINNVLLTWGATPPGPTVIIEEDFEDYTVGGKLAEQAQTMGRMYWTTWSGAVGGAEDPTVSDAQFVSGSNSMLIEQYVDAVLLLDTYTSGVFNVDFDVYIPIGKLGYFNLLQACAGSSSSWGTQTYFNAGGAGLTDAGGAGTGVFTYTYDTWHHVSTMVDLDADYAEMYFNGDFIVSWVWSSGAFGSNTLNEFNAMNFYGAAADNSTFYDNLLITMEPVVRVNATTSVYTQLSEADKLIAYDRAETSVATIPITSVGKELGLRSSALLYDNGPLVNSAGTGVGGADESILMDGITTIGVNCNNGAGYHMADDFIVDADWTVESFVFYAYQTNGGIPSTITAGYFQIYDGDPSAGGSVIYGDLATNVMISTQWSNIYRNSDGPGGSTNRAIMEIECAATGLTLTPGIYWVEWTCEGSASSGPWAPPITISGQPETGNGLQWTGTAWQAFASGGFNQGVPFLINGTDSGIVGANVYRDGVLIAEMVQDVFYLDTDIDYGLHEYCVTYVYESLAESCLDNCIEVEVTEDCSPPEDLTVELVEYNHVHLLWDQYVPPTGEWIFYHDGSFENGFYSTAGGAGLAQVFTPSEYPVTVTEVRYWNDDYGSPTQENEVYLLTGDGASVLAGPYSVTGEPGDTWVTVDIDDVTLESGTFMVYTANVLPDGPSVGVDDSFYDGTLYFGSPGAFTELGEYGYYYVGSHEAFVTYGELSANVSPNSTVLRPADATNSISAIAISNHVSGEVDKPLDNTQTRSFVGYNIYHNGELLEALWPDNYYNYYEMQPGSHCYTVTAEYSYCGESDPSNEECVTIELVTQSIDLDIGWNIMSFYIVPDNMDMLNILQTLINSNELTKVIDESGGFIQDIPGVGWMNTIGNMANTEGYYIKVANGNTLEASGMPLASPFTIPLSSGWNMISYPFDESQNALTALQTLVNSTELIKVINEKGDFIQFIPGVGWMNTIGDFEPDEGYYIKVTANTNINIIRPGTGWQCGDPLEDTRDGQTYNTVQIGDQCWMAENLNVGARIDGVVDQTDNSTIEKYCYNDDVANCDTYGGLYQWDEMMQYVTTEGVQGICSDGWHLPTVGEWNSLVNYLGGDYLAGGKMKETGYTHWFEPNTGATNSSFFTALPSGDRATSGSFYGLGNYGYCWSSTEYASTNAKSLGQDNTVEEVKRINFSKEVGASIRCLKD